MPSRGLPCLVESLLPSNPKSPQKLYNNSTKRNSTKSAANRLRTSWPLGKKGYRAGHILRQLKFLHLFLVIFVCYLGY